MTSTPQIKEEFYVRQLFGDDVPFFVDATRYARDRRPYPLTAKKALKATCGVRTDDDVVAFSLRDYTARQAEREVEQVEETVGGVMVTRRNVLRPRMPRKTLHELSETARELSAVLDGDDVIAELDGELYVLALTRTHGGTGLRVAGRLAGSPEGYVRSEFNDTDAEFKLPISGVRLRVFLRSPVRRRLIAYAFGGYLARKPGEVETLTRAAALALNGILGLATFRMLSGFDRVEVPPAPGGTPIRQRHPAAPLAFTVPVRLFTDDGTPAARGHVTLEIDLERLDPASGGLALRVSEGEGLEWDPAAVGLVRLETYQQVLSEAIGELIDTSLGADAVREIGYDIMLGDRRRVAMAALRYVVADLPGLVVTPGRAEVRSG